ncbi:hypothetical protein CJ739_1829 [Mariniflexile rhizosphaerae]|uniref:hypothetical protein n=1 Tax=unclassified Mariniflexile TaxID=2643887 RepID=UPI000CBC297C|nr:hypothetical protein [Mariniflexile sp. TRM1-10]AXP80914.1 hypothetical protein CJ739_1829 [Mariniflexile sp. TRM1-10]PLB20011.1 MAG: hypothetical protein TRG1_1275 [Flavobacteriaceae bacterium FS1-H7996/R]
MTSIDYLIKKLKELHANCEFLDIKYEYKKYLNTHIIDVRPKEFFETDTFYVASQLSLEDEFEELFPTEEIIFISDNELIEIEKPILILKAIDIREFEVAFNTPFLDEIFFEDMNTTQIVGAKCYSFESLDFIDIEEIENEIEIKIPPPKPWWSKKNKKSSKHKLELFFV